MKIRKTWIVGLCFVLGLVLAVFINSLSISNCTKGRVFEAVNKLPEIRLAVLLGTAHGPNKLPFQHYEARIEKAGELMLSGGTDQLIVSGSTCNSIGENELQLMLDDLLELGVDRELILLDSSGVNTRTTVERIAQHHDSAIFISQRSHLERAIYLAGLKNLEAFGCNAGEYHKWQFTIREMLARVKMRFR